MDNLNSISFTSLSNSSTSSVEAAPPVIGGNSEKFSSAGRFDKDGQLLSALAKVSTGAVRSVASEAPKIPAVNASMESAKKKDAASVQEEQKRLAAVTNAQFIDAVFHNVPAGASPLVCAKSGDPSIGGAWIPQPAKIVHGLAANTNNYFNCASVKPDNDGTFHARKDAAVAFHCLVLDDVGTKVAIEGLAGIQPSWALETSPGNYQVGFILVDPLTSEADVARLQNAVIAAGLSDPGAKGMARWMRLPVGINGKQKYKTSEGKRFQCRLRRWHPERRYTVDEIVVMLKLNLDAPLAPAPHSPTENAASTDTVAVVPEREIDQALLAQIKQLLMPLDPDCSRAIWIKAMMAIHHETDGSDDGLALFDEWSSKGTKYKGVKDVETQWRSLKKNTTTVRTIGTLIWMAREAGADTNAIMKTSQATVSRAPGTVSPLTQYSLKNSLVELEKQRVEQRLIFGNIVLLGQATVIYAFPGTGKTLIILRLIIEAIKQSLFDPSKLYYINMDDNSSGLVDKVHLSVEYGFNMLADGHKGFEAKTFRAAMLTMIENNTASGVIVVLDTLKKFVNTMSKVESAEFTKVVRQFALKGGTVIALHHGNKNPGPDGKVRYSGTTDVVDDFDCAFTVNIVTANTEANMKVVEFENFKRRGDVAATAAYSYSTERGLSYGELLTSVQEVDPDKLEPLKQAAELQSDAPVIAAIEACIAEGITTKMMMSDAGSKRANVSTRIALRVIEKYTGDDANLHRWRYAVGARGAHVFELLQPPQVPLVVAVDKTQPLDTGVSPMKPAKLPSEMPLPTKEAAIVEPDTMTLEQHYAELFPDDDDGPVKTPNMSNDDDDDDFDIY